MTGLYHVTRSCFVTYYRREPQLEGSYYLVEVCTGNIYCQGWSAQMTLTKWVNYLGVWSCKSYNYLENQKGNLFAILFENNPRPSSYKHQKHFYYVHR